MKKYILGFLCLLTITSAEAANFTGRYATNWGIIELRQDGKTVTGTYSVPAPGDIQGTIENDTLVYRWLQSSGIWGMGRFKLLEAGQKIHGTWGNGKSYDNGGVWEGNRE